VVEHPIPGERRDRERKDAVELEGELHRVGFSGDGQVGGEDVVTSALGDRRRPEGHLGGDLGVEEVGGVQVAVAVGVLVVVSLEVAVAVAVAVGVGEAACVRGVPGWQPCSLAARAGGSSTA